MKNKRRCIRLDWKFERVHVARKRAPKIITTLDSMAFGKAFAAIRANLSRAISRN